MQVKRRLAAGVAIALASSCAPEHHGARERLCAGSGCTQECRELRVEACDIRDPECLDVIFKSLQCVRGNSLDATPKVEITDSLLAGERDEPEEFEDRTSAAASTSAAAPSSGAATGISAPSTETQDTAKAASSQTARRKLEKQAERVFKYYIDEGVKLLHFIPETSTIDDATDDEEENAGAHESGGHVVVESDNVGHRWLSMQLVVHEFVHAQQEADYGGIPNLFERYPKTTTSRQSVRALIEGEADLYGFLTHAFMRDVSTDDWDLVQFFDEAAKDKRRLISTLTAPWTHADWWLHYPVGARALAERWQAGGNLAVRAVHHNLEPDFGAWARDFTAAGGAPLSSEVTCSPSRTEVIVRDELGPSGLFSLLMAASRDKIVKPVEPAWQLARALVDDKLDFFAPVLPDDETQTQWFANAAIDDCLRAQEQEPTPVVSVDAGTTSVDAGNASALRDAGDAGTDASPADAQSGPATMPMDETPPQDCGEKVTSGGASGSASSDDPIAYSRLLPSGGVWLSWRLAFDTRDHASEFVGYFDELDWKTVEVSQDGAKVLIKARRNVTSDEQRAQFAAWDASALCEN